MIVTATTALEEVNNYLTSMRSVILEADLDGKTAFERESLNLKFEDIKTSIQNISDNTSWRGKTILNGTIGLLRFQIGSQQAQTVELTFADINTDFGENEVLQAGVNANEAENLDVFTNLSKSYASNSDGDEAIDLNSQILTGNQQTTTLDYIDRAITKISNHQENLKIAKAQLTHQSELLEKNINNSQKSLARHINAQDASEIARFLRTQILQQAGKAQLSQANHSTDSVSHLLNS